jgi:hypothetical protein
MYFKNLNIAISFNIIMLHLTLMSSNKKINELKKDYFAISLLAYLIMLKRKK